MDEAPIVDLPSVKYNPDGDCIEVILKPDHFYGEWVNHNLTIFRSHETDEIVGFLIDNAKGII